MSEVCEGKYIYQMTGDDLRAEVKRLRDELDAVLCELERLRLKVRGVNGEGSEVLRESNSTKAAQAGKEGTK